MLGIGAASSGRAKLSMFDISDPENVFEICTFNRFYENANSLGKNHKAILVSKSKNIIGFASDKEYHIIGYSSEYGRFSYANKLTIPVTAKQKATGNKVRGIYIGDYFYVCNRLGINSYSIADFVDKNYIASPPIYDSLVFE